MGRQCKGICFQTKNQHIFSDKALQYDEGSRCSICETWIKQPTNSKLDIIIECESDAQYYDIEGKPIATKLLYPIKQLVKKVRCICCGTQARGKTHHIGVIKNKHKSKQYFMFEFDEKGNLRKLGRVSIKPLKPIDKKTIKELGLKRPPRGISTKKEANNIEEDNINYEGQESVFDLRGTELQ
jgi:hypothetical protein